MSEKVHISGLMSRRNFVLGAPLMAASLGAMAQSATNNLVSPFNKQMKGFLQKLHDPVMIKEGDTYHVFSSGGWDRTKLMSWRTSKDLINWVDNGPVLTALPAWAKAAVPNGESCWAPDISYVDGVYRLYFSVSTGGSMRSAIGLFTSKTLDKSSPDYGWTDHGLVFETRPGDGFNAIDQNFVIDYEGNHWLAFGSYWTGLKLIPLDKKTGKPKPGDKTIYSIAARPAPDGGDNAIEAAFIIKRNGFYYLFASYDHCCRMNFSDYYVAVGRSKKITGPYVDREGRSMMDGYATTVIAERPYLSHRFIAPGHCGIYQENLGQENGRDLLIYHAYDRDNNAEQTLRISELKWSPDGWPSAEM